VDYRERISSDASAIRGAIKGALSDLWTASPGIVQTTSLGKDGQLTATVQPAVMAKQLAPDGSRKDVALPLLVDVPIVYPRGGGYSLTFPVAKDDEVLVVFGARCIDNWWQSGGVQPQHELRFHDLSDGFAIAGPFSQKTKIEVSDKTTQLRSNDGKMHIELDSPNSQLTILTDPISLTLNYAAKTVVLKGSDTVEIDSPTVTIKGDLKVTGEVTAHSSGASVSLTTHTTSNVQGGLGTSGPPVPGT